MAVKYICDGCGIERPAKFYKTNPNVWFKPENWFQRSDEDGIQDACSRTCIDIISSKSGKTTVVIPV